MNGCLLLVNYVHTYVPTCIAMINSAGLMLCTYMLPPASTVHYCSIYLVVYTVLPSHAPTATPFSGRPLAVLGVNCRHTLLYNIGLQQLFLGKPSLAFESLLEAVQVYHSNPRLWLRLAEACIATHCVVSAPTNP